VEAVASHRAPLVTGEQGRRALALAQTIADKMATDAPLQGRGTAKDTTAS
jgi:hypothetical protein